jgi:uncharacterized protein YgbK (DUF1537 family)
VTTWPAVRQVPSDEVLHVLPRARRVVVLDDDPTGTQTVRDVPVLTRWNMADVVWAIDQPTAGFFVLTNTRSLPPDQAAARNREVVRACLEAADRNGVQLAFASRGDSTLRGHFPLETDAIGDLAPADAVLLAPAYVDAGRVTIGGTHWLRTAGGLLPVAQSEFARDATFGYRSSRLDEWVAEKSGGRIRPDSVLPVTLQDIRQRTTESLAGLLAQARGGQVVALDAETDDDLRAVALAVLAAEAAGSRFTYRVGPSFVRARLGQSASPPIENERLAQLVKPGTHGLVVVGSHIALTSRQLARLAQRRRLAALELDVPSGRRRARRRPRPRRGAGSGGGTPRIAGCAEHLPEPGHRHGQQRQPGDRPAGQRRTDGSNLADRRRLPALVHSGQGRYHFLRHRYQGAGHRPGLGAGVAAARNRLAVGARVRAGQRAAVRSVRRKCRRRGIAG